MKTTGKIKEGALMRKTGKNKAVAMLIVVAMVIGMLPMGILPAFAALTDVTVKGPSDPSDFGIVKGGSEMAAGDIAIEEANDTDIPNAETMFTVICNDTNTTSTSTGNLEFFEPPTVKYNDAVVSTSGYNGTSFTFKVIGRSTATDKIVISNIKYNLDAGSTGTKTYIHVLSGALNKNDDNGEIKDGIAVSVVDPTSLKPIEPGKAEVANKINIKETAKDLLKKDATISLKINTAGVTFEPGILPVATETATNFALSDYIANVTEQNTKATWTVKTTSNADASGVEIFLDNLKLKVDSSVTTAGKIEILVSTSVTDLAVSPSKVKNAEIKISGLNVTALSQPKVTADANNQAAGNIKIEEKAKATLKETKKISLSLPSGVTFAAKPTAAVSGLALEKAEGTLVGLGTVEWTVKTESTAPGNITISNIAYNVASSVAAGAINVEVYNDGVKVATVSNAQVSADPGISVSSTKPNVLRGAVGQAGGVITMTEGKAGSIEGTITVGVLNADVLFGKAPTATVKSGNAVVGGVTLDADSKTATFVVTKGDKVSVIEITGVEYVVLTKAELGGLILQVKQKGTILSNISNATIVSTLAPKFADVPATHWAFSYIENLVAKGILAGYTDGSFKPSNTITRAEFAKIVAVAKGLGTATGSSFSDTSGHWAAGYIEAVKAAGIIGGYADGTFRPNSNISRAEIAKMVVVAAGFTTDTSGAGFSDIAGHWASDYILTANNKGIVGGYTDGTFRPNNSATRAEASKMVSIWVNM